MVYWDPLQDHSWNDKVCHESLSQCQSNFCLSPKLKNSIFWGHKGQLGGQLSVFGLRNHRHRNCHEILLKNVRLIVVLVQI